MSGHMGDERVTQRGLRGRRRRRRARRCCSSRAPCPGPTGGLVSCGRTPDGRQRAQSVGGKTARVELDDEVFGVERQRAAAARGRQGRAGRAAAQGTHSTKTRGQVAGGGAKPWRQKGTGRARQGTTRAPQWRGGGVVFGPHAALVPPSRSTARLRARRARIGALAARRARLAGGLRRQRPSTRRATKDAARAARRLARAAPAGRGASADGEADAALSFRNLARASWSTPTSSRSPTSCGPRSCCLAGARSSSCRPGVAAEEVAS